MSEHATRSNRDERAADEEAPRQTPQAQARTAAQGTDEEPAYTREELLRDPAVGQGTLVDDRRSSAEEIAGALRLAVDTKQLPTEGPISLGQLAQAIRAYRTLEV